MRTRAEIIAQTEARLAELEGELERKVKRDAEQAERDVFKKRFACAKCRWGREDYYRGKGGLCAHPLVQETVLKRKIKSVDYYLFFRPDAEHMPTAFGGEVVAHLCGLERALWHAKLTLWQRLLGWLGLIDTDKVGEHRWSDEGPAESLKPKPSKNYWFVPASTGGTTFAVAYLDQARAIKDADRFQAEELQRADITTTHLKPSETTAAHCK